jgi:hypothetical protein
MNSFFLTKIAPKYPIKYSLLAPMPKTRHLNALVQRILMLPLPHPNVPSLIRLAATPTAIERGMTFPNVSLSGAATKAITPTGGEVLSTSIFSPNFVQRPTISLYPPTLPLLEPINNRPPLNQPPNPPPILRRRLTQLKWPRFLLRTTMLRLQTLF